jgi:hypothetical protein
MSITKTLLNQLRVDAAFSAFLDQDLQSIEAELYRIVYTDLKARMWLPPKSDVHPGAETYAYRVLDGVGAAAIGHHMSDELPMASVRQEKKVGRIETVFNAFGYTKQELRAAGMVNMPLDRELAMIQMRAHEERFNELTLVGNSGLGWNGLFNQPDVPVIAAVDWDNGATTGLQILADLRKLVNQIISQSRGVFTPNQLILPMSSYLAAQAKPLGPDFSATDNALSAFTRTTGFPLEVGWDVNLETAGVGGVKRAVAYQKDVRTAQYVQPLAPEIGEPDLHNLRYTRTIESRVGEVAFKQPLAFAYLDSL